MWHWVYAAFDIGAVVGAVSVALWRHQEWLQHWRRTALAVGLVAAGFVAWDVAVTHLGHWSFNPEFILGWHILNLPVEEVAFFIAIPLISLAVWEACSGAGRPRLRWVVWLAVPVVVAAVLATTYSTRAYSLAASGAAGLVAAWVYAWRARLDGRQWLTYQLVMLVIFTVANSVLTGLPVVLYNPETFSTIRLGTIPLEDYLYNFALTNAIVLAWQELARRAHSAR